MIEPEDYELEDSNPWVGGPAILPTQAKDMMGFTAVIVRSYAENGMTEQLRHDYGITVDEAWLSLKCVELATLPAWDAEALLDAATVYLTHSSSMAARDGYVIEGNIHEDMERVKRRIRLAMLAEKMPDLMSPIDGVLLLRRVGINVFHELLDAVAMMALDGPNPERTYRQLKSIAEPQQSVPDSQPTPPVPVVVDSASNAPVPKPKAKRRTWLDVSSAYIVEVMQTGQYATAKELYRALEAKAGPNTPFDKGSGANRGSLFVREIARALGVKTVQNNWRFLREMAKK